MVLHVEICNPFSISTNELEKYILDYKKWNKYCLCYNLKIVNENEIKIKVKDDTERTFKMNIDNKTLNYKIINGIKFNLILLLNII